MNASQIQRSNQNPAQNQNKKKYKKIQKFCEQSHYRLKTK